MVVSKKGFAGLKSKSVSIHFLLGFGLLGLLAGCGSSSNSSSSSSSHSSSSSTSSSTSSNSSSNSSSNGSSSAPSVSEQGSLDWNWTQEAQAYCADHQNDAVVPGAFQVLRPEQSRYMHSSEHFVMRWNDGDNVNISQATIDTALQTFESVWDFYINQLHFPEPYWDSATKYKVSVNVSDQGYASGAGTGERDPEMWVHYDALAHVGTLAHEFAHTLQYTTRSMRDSKYVGWLWESHANWMAHQFNPEDVQCTEALVNAPHIYYGSTRNRYCNWQFFEFIKDNSCPEFLNDALWKNGIKPDDPAHWTADPFSTLAANADWSDAELNDIFADWALHNVHWDYQDSGDTYLKNYGSNHNIQGGRRFRVTRLQPTGSQNEYEVPNYWAPQRWGYNLVEILPESGRNQIWVDFAGQVQATSAINAFDSGYALQPETVGKPNASWRWSVVVTQADGSPRYSALQRGSSARLQVDLKPSDQSVWLVVMATPTQIQTIFWDQIYYSIYRYPWRIKLDGARPAQFQDVLPNTETQVAGAAHVNGGGWVAATAQVDSSIYVAPSAKILGSARVTGNARIEGHAIVNGNARVSGSAVIRDYALISGSANIRDNAIVQEHAAILAGTVQERAKVGAMSLVDGSSTVIGGDAVVATTMNAINGKSVVGSAQLLGDMELNASVNRGAFYGYVNTSELNDPAFGAERTGPAKEVTDTP